jgi:hypothetical protein
VKSTVLSQDQIEQFIDRGYTRLEEAFPAERALEAQKLLWNKVEEKSSVRLEDRSTWTKPMVHLQEGYDDPVFRDCMTDRLSDAVEDLVGRGRWQHYGDRTIGWGWWPVNFSLGADQPWDVPANGWHWDGIQFTHTVDAPDQGLLLLCMFSEIGKHGGGTLVAEGSHQVVARFLNQHPQGISVHDGIKQVNATHPWIHELTSGGVDPYAPGQSADTAKLNAPPTPLPVDGIPYRVHKFMRQETIDADGTRLRVAETTANPGDIFLCHPFLYHAASQNHSGKPRFMCNRTTPLKERLKFNREDGDYSAVEISIRRALKMAN